MTVALRAHHLLCMLTYVGKGYSPVFVENYDRVAARLSAGEAIRLVDGPDDICAPLLGDADAHCRLDRVLGRDRAALQAAEAVLGRTLRTGDVFQLSKDGLGRMRAAFVAGSSRVACEGCEWSDLCSRIAGEKFAGARISRSS